MDFAWTDEQAAFRREVIRFAKEELNDRLIERDQTSEFSWDAWKKCAKLGIQGLPIPSEYGGGDADCLTTVCALDALDGCRDNGLLFALNAHMWSSEIPLLTYGTKYMIPEQIELLDVLPKTSTGKIDRVTLAEGVRPVAV